MPALNEEGVVGKTVRFVPIDELKILRDDDLRKSLVKEGYEYS